MGNPVFDDFMHEKTSALTRVLMVVSAKIGYKVFCLVYTRKDKALDSSEKMLFKYLLKALRCNI